MGGGLAQGLALGHPGRVASLTLIATAPAAPGPEDPDLPSMSDETIAQFSIDAPDWSDRGAAVDYMTHLARVSAGRAYPLDEAAFRPLAARVFDRTRSMASTMTNHNVVLGAGERIGSALGRSTCRRSSCMAPMIPSCRTEMRWRSCAKSAARACSRWRAQATIFLDRCGTSSYRRSS